MSARLTCLALLLAACGDDVSAATDLNGSIDLSAISDDLSTSAIDLGTVDLAQPARDFAVADLAGRVGVGEHCGGNIINPPECLPGLVCVYNGIPDEGGTCANPDAGACSPNGISCAQSSECCSVNCVIRGDAGVCCVPGGCP